MSQNEITTQDDDLSVPVIPEEFDNADETEIDKELLELNRRAKEELPEDLYKAMTKIAYQISQNGMTVEEACLLANYNHKVFKNYLQKNELVARIIQVKELQYKRDLLTTLNQHARSGDHKLAQWFLERRFPEEFGSKKRGSDANESNNMLQQAIIYIQQNGDKQPIVGQSGGQPMVVERKDGKTLIKRVSQILK